MNGQMLTGGIEDKNVVCAKFSDWETHNSGEIYF